MKKKIAAFIDASYFMSGGAYLLSGQRKSRSSINLNINKFLDFIDSFIEEKLDGEIFRIYWYDGVNEIMSQEQQTIALAEQVKFRAGIVNRAGRQKGIDTRMVLDMYRLAHARLIDQAVILAGDENLAVGVEAMQELGVQTHLLVLQGSAVSLDLQRSSDFRSVINVESRKDYLSVSHDESAPACAQAGHEGDFFQGLAPVRAIPEDIDDLSLAEPHHEENIELVLELTSQLFENLSAQEIERAVAAFRANPQFFLFDGSFLSMVSERLGGRPLKTAERHRMREHILARLRKIAGEGLPA